MPRAHARRVHTVTDLVAALEPRQLLTTCTATPLADEYAIPAGEPFTIAPPAGTVGFGTTAAVLGDLDDDGADDFAISAPGTAPGVALAVNGKVFVYSGKTQSLIRTITGFVPGFGSDWRQNNLTNDAVGGRSMHNIAAYVTSWGGLSIAGIDSATDQPMVYWWAPGVGDWKAELIHVKDESADTQWPDPHANLCPVVRGTELNIISVSDVAGEVVRMFWNPGDGNTWTLENLTELAQE